MTKNIKAAFAGLIICAGALLPAEADAQLPMPRLGIAGGVTQYDLSGTGTAPFGAVRVELPLAAIILEGSLGAFRPEEQAGVRRTYIIPEAQLQVQLFPMIVRPYLGIGGGWFRAVSGPDPRVSEVTGSVSGGVRIGVPALPFSIRAELRVRGIGSGFEASAAEWTIGLSR